MMSQVKVGIIGCGDICNAYLYNINKFFDRIKIIACTDLVSDKAKAMANKFEIPKLYSTVEELLVDAEIDVVLNLTIPEAHTKINIDALEAGKHVYCEKPFALDLVDAKNVIAIAAEKKLYIGCAPDTFLGAGLQTCRKIIDEGYIGKPIAATANFLSSGPEKIHPNPEFFYKTCAGPMMDTGPYYLTALVSILGPIKKLDCYATRTFEKRTILSQAKKGDEIKVNVFTHYSGIMEFANGAIANMNMSFDVWKSNLPHVEIYGTEGSLIVPNPNLYNGPIKLLRGESILSTIEGLNSDEAAQRFYSDEALKNFKEIPSANYKFNGYMRGLGLLDMCNAIHKNQKHRTSPDLFYHVLEALLGFDIAAKEKRTYDMLSSCGRPCPLN